MKILIVIPARGGSKRIPRKNVRIMCGRPLIQYSLDNALSLSQKYETDVVVSTDDEEVENIAGKRQGIRVLKRPEELARDSITLDPVIYDALCRVEEEKGFKYDLVLTMQATSPTLKKETLLAAVEEFIAGDLDTMISVVNRTHLSWKEENGKIVKNYEKRLNSQELPKNFQETGGFLLSRRTVVNRDSRIGEKVGVYEIDSFEAVDIDTEEDWIVAEAILRRKRILFRTVGQQKLGMGHIYRCLTLAYKLIGHELLFVTDEESTLGIQKLKESFFPMKVIKDEEQFEQILCEYRPDIVVNDILDTEAAYMQMVKRYAPRVVNFEDEGTGAPYADAVINALYEHGTRQKTNVYEGFKYFCIRDEFLEEPPKEFSTEVKNVMIIFGGADPADLTGKLYRICMMLHEAREEVEFHFITGFAYGKKDEVVSIPEKNIFVHHDVKRVSQYMGRADLAITSQGRTIYELASMGVPAIVMAQNEREAEHVFAGIQNGFINLGLGERCDAGTIMKTMVWIMDTPNVRREMRQLQLSREFAKGQDRVIALILGAE